MSPLEEAEQVPFLQRRSLLKVFVLKTSKLLRTHSLVFQITVRVVPWLRFDIHTLNPLNPLIPGPFLLSPAQSLC